MGRAAPAADRQVELAHEPVGERAAVQPHHAAPASPLVTSTRAPGGSAAGADRRSPGRRAARSARPRSRPGCPGDDHRPREQRVRVARHQQQGLDLRPDDRAARGEGVRGGAGRGGHSTPSQPNADSGRPSTSSTISSIRSRLLFSTVASLSAQLRAISSPLATPRRRWSSAPRPRSRRRRSRLRASSRDSCSASARKPTRPRFTPSSGTPAGRASLGGAQQGAVAAEHQHDLRTFRAARQAVDDRGTSPGGRSPTAGPPPTRRRAPAAGRRPRPAGGRRRPPCAGWSADRCAGRGAPRGSSPLPPTAGHRGPRRRPASIAGVPLAPGRAAGSTRRCPTAPAAGWRPRRAAPAPAPGPRRRPRRARPPQLRVAHHAAGAEPLPSHLELGLDHRQQVAARPGAGGERGQHRAQRDEREVGHDESTGPPMSSGSRPRTLVRSSTCTRSSLRSRHTSWP